MQRGEKMIEYKVDILEALKEKGYPTTRLRKEKLLPESTIQRIRKGNIVTLNTLDTVCELLDMQPGDIIQHKR